MTKTNSGSRGSNAAFRWSLMVSGAMLAPIAALFFAAPALAQGSTTTDAMRNYDVQAQPLAGALRQYMQQSGVQVGYPSDIGQDVVTSAVKGSFSAADALGRLLSGSGLTYRFTGANTATLERAPQTAQGTIQLGTLRVEGVGAPGGGSGSGNGAGGLADPYISAAPVSHISREQIERVPPVSAGDIFKSTPGVISTGSRAGLGLNVNIRGLQGMNRVATLIDGTQQSTSGYIGYRGQTSSVFVDPDFISSVDISKGPSDGPLGNGAMGGVVNMRTLSIDDLLSDGQSYGVQIKLGAGSNTVTSPVGSTIRHNEPSSIFKGNSWNGSAAGAFRTGKFDWLLAVSKREAGNYLAGRKGENPADALSPVKPGEEVFDTSENIFSAIVKARVNLSESLKLDFGYIRYDNKHGELNDYPYIYNFFPAQQGKLGRTKTDTYSARLQFNPEDNDLINLNGHLWLTDVEREPYGVLADLTQVRTYGAEIYNVSIFADGKLPITYGAQLSIEDADNPEVWREYGGTLHLMQSGPAGKRQMSSLFARADYIPSDFLTVSAGLRVDNYHLKQGGGVLATYGNSSATRVNPTFSVTVQPWEGLYFHSQYSRGWRPPALRESSFILGEILFPNPDLKPERAENYEFVASYVRDGVLFSQDNIRLKFSYFSNNYDDYIIRDSIAGDWSEPRHWTNIDKATFKGYDISLRYDLRGFYVEGDYTKYTDIAFCHRLTGCIDKGLGIDYGSNYIPPEYNLTLTAGARLFDEKLNIGARLNHFGKRAVTDMVGGYVTPTYWSPQTTIDMFGSYAVTDKVKVNFSVSNLTDRYYLDPLALSRAPAPGRTFRIGLTSKFGDGSSAATERNQSGRTRNSVLGGPLAGEFGGDWTGLYVGAHLSGGRANTKGVTTDANGTTGGIPATESAHFKVEGITGGLQAGYNHQFGDHFVIGVEGDFSPFKLSDTRNVIATESATLTDNQALQASYRHDFSNLITLRGRLGYNLGRTLVYGTTGPAWIREEQTRTQYRSMTATANVPNGTATAAFSSEKFKVSRAGWSVGGGMQYAIDNRWSIKADYLYARFARETFDFPDARAGVSARYTVTTVLRDPVTGVALRDPDTGAIRREITVHSGTSETVTGRKANNRAEVQSLRIGINYRF